MAIAALEIGAVSAHPISTETKIPIIRGCCIVDQLIISPNQVMNELIGGPINVPTKNPVIIVTRSEEHTSELQSRGHLVCRLLLEKKKTKTTTKKTVDQN